MENESPKKRVGYKLYLSALILAGTLGIGGVLTGVVVALHDQIVVVKEGSAFRSGATKLLNHEKWSALTESEQQAVDDVLDPEIRQVQSQVASQFRDGKKFITSEQMDFFQKIGDVEEVDGVKQDSNSARASYHRHNLVMNWLWGSYFSYKHPVQYALCWSWTLIPAILLIMMRKWIVWLTK